MTDSPKEVLQEALAQAARLKELVAEGEYCRLDYDDYFIALADEVLRLAEELRQAKEPLFRPVGVYEVEQLHKKLTEREKALDAVVEAAEDMAHHCYCTDENTPILVRLRSALAALEKS